MLENTAFLGVLRRPMIHPRTWHLHLHPAPQLFPFLPFPTPLTPGKGWAAQAGLCHTQPATLCQYRQARTSKLKGQGSDQASCLLSHLKRKRKEAGEVPGGFQPCYESGQVMTRVVM